MNDGSDKQPRKINLHFKEYIPEIKYAIAIQAVERP